MLVTLLPKINKPQAIKQLRMEKNSNVHFYINKMAHKEYAQHKIEFNAKLKLRLAVNANINLITLSYKILKIWGHGWNPD